MLFNDTGSNGGWVLIGNSDVVPSVGTGQNGQISVYHAPELYGPWGQEQVLVTASDLNSIPGVAEALNVTIGVVERPKLHFHEGFYYLFLHLEPEEGYTLRSLGIFKLKQLAPHSPNNPWITVFAGHPGKNPRTQEGFQVLDFGLFYDSVSSKLLFSATTDSYRFPGECCEEDPPGSCNYTKTNMCANTALVTFDVDLDATPLTFNPIGTLPGRWEAPTLFRNPNDETTLYMMYDPAVNLLTRNLPFLLLLSLAHR